MPTLADRVVDILVGDAAPTHEHAAQLLHKPAHDEHTAVLRDVLEAWRLSRPRVEHVRDVPAEDLTVVTMLTPTGITGELYVTTSRTGALGGVRMRTPVPPISTAEDLRVALLDIDPEAAVVTDPGACRDRPVKAISSLFKLFVLLAVLDDVAQGRLTLQRRHVVDAQDLSWLSAGLTARHIGTPVSVAELCQLMALQSDNTATDILIGIVGRPAVLAAMELCGADPALNTPLRTTRELIEQAWLGESLQDAVHAGTGGDRDGSTSDRLRDLATLQPVHADGLDWFCDLGAVADALRRLDEFPWTPWATGSASPSSAPPLLYKGGSGPGVLTAGWHRRTDDGPRSLVFALNCPAPLGAFEELFAFTCAEKALQGLGMR